MRDQLSVGWCAGEWVADEGGTYRIRGRVQVGEINIPFDRVVLADSYDEAQALVRQAVGGEMGVGETDVAVTSASRRLGLLEVQLKRSLADEPGTAA